MLRGGQIQVTPLLAATILGWFALGVTDVVKNTPIPMQLHGYVCSVLATCTVTCVIANLLNRRAAQTPQPTASEDEQDHNAAAIAHAVELGRRLERREHGSSNVHALRGND
jgi:hypothetical protein